MPTILNETPAASHPVTIDGQLDDAGDLTLHSPAGLLDEDDQLYIKHRRPNESDPVSVPITVTGPSGWALGVEHFDDGTSVTWPNQGTGQCLLTWAETGGEKKVIITARPPASLEGEPKKKTIFIKVGSDPELPV